MFVYRGQNVGGITQGFSKGDPRDILKDMMGGSGQGRANSRRRPRKLDRVARSRQGPNGA